VFNNSTINNCNTGPYCDRYWCQTETEVARLRLKCDGTRAETRFRLSAKRTSPFKSAGASVQSTTGSRGVRISGGNAEYTEFRGSVRVLATHTIRQIPLHFPAVRHSEPSHFNWTLPLGIHVLSCTQNNTVHNKHENNYRSQTILDHRAGDPH
jgi:hypothetical protein